MQIQCGYTTPAHYNLPDSPVMQSSSSTQVASWLAPSCCHACKEICYILSLRTIIEVFDGAYNLLVM